MKLSGVVIRIGFGDRVVRADNLERAGVARRPAVWLVGTNWWGRIESGVPGVGDDDVVEWLVSAPEAGEADLDNHGGNGRGELTTTTEIERLKLVS